MSQRLQTCKWIDCRADRDREKCRGVTDGERCQAAGTLIPVGDLPCTGGDSGAVVAGGCAGSSRWDGPKMENE